MPKKILFTVVTSVALALTACSTTSSAKNDTATRRQEVDAGADAALTRLYADTAGARELVAKAKGVLVIPRLVSAGLVVGGSHGQGELRVGGSPVGYYSATSASLGLIAGAQSKDVFLLFMTDESLERFRASSGWTAGVDASVALVKVGTGGRLDTENARHQVIGFVLSNGGLMADLSFEGTKLSRIEL